MTERSANPSDPAERASSGPARLSILARTWHGVKRGVRFVSWFALPIGFVALVLGLVPTAFGYGAGRGLRVYAWQLGGLGFYLVFVFYGVLIGGVIGFCVGVASWVRGLSARARGHTSGVDGVWAFLNRPIGGRSRKTDEVVLTVDEPSWMERGRPKPRRWVRAVVWYAGLASHALLVASFVAGFVVGQIVDRRLSAAIASANRDDPRWRLEDVMADREPVPAAENSAFVAKRALALLPRNWPKPPLNTPSRPNTPPSPLDEAVERLYATEDNARLDEETASILRDERAKYPEALQLARSMADYRRGRHELTIAKAPFETLLPDTQAARTLSRFLEVDAALRAQDGDLDGALDSCRAIVGVSRSIGDEPFLISMLVRVAIDSSGLKMIRRVMGQGEPSEAALVRFQALALDEMTQPLLQIGMKGERAMLDAAIARLASGDLSFSEFQFGTSKERQPPESPWLRLRFAAERALMLEQTQGLIDIARLPPHERPARLYEWEMEVERRKAEPFAFYSSASASYLLPDMKVVEKACSRVQAELGCAAILMAAERHRRKTGVWPEAIEAIDREILPEPPLDPFSGEPFVMQTSDGMFLVYSLGPNLLDEEGDYDPKLWGEEISDDAGTRAYAPDQRGLSPVE